VWRGGRLGAASVISSIRPRPRRHECARPVL
jgi:hypothetical protein